MNNGVLTNLTTWYSCPLYLLYDQLYSHLIPYVNDGSVMHVINAVIQNVDVRNIHQDIN